MEKTKKELIEKLDKLKLYLGKNDVNNVSNEIKCDTNNADTLYENKIINISAVS
jgi:hypothetical protein